MILKPVSLLVSTAVAVLIALPAFNHETNVRVAYAAPVSSYDSVLPEDESNIEGGTTKPHSSSTSSLNDHAGLVGSLSDDPVDTGKHYLRRAEEEIVEVIPDMSDSDIKRVMEWIAAEVGMVKNPFCWKDSYGRGVGTIPGRVADCPAGYTNHGLTCWRGSDDYWATSKVAACPAGYTNMGLTCFRGAHITHAPSKTPSCPGGYTNTGYTCHKWWPPHTMPGGTDAMTCPSGYFKSSWTARCHKICPSGYQNDGEFCTRHAHSLGMSHMKCPSGYFQSKVTARCHQVCKSGYSNTGETCHRPVSILGRDSMSCRTRGRNPERKGAGGTRCYPQHGNCFDNGEEDAGLCYKRCRTNYDGVGPVCWGVCDHSMVNCGAACAKSSEDCALAVFDQVTTPLVVAANVASMGLTTPATAGATQVIKVGGKTVAGTSLVGKALVKAVNLLKTVKPSGLEKGASITQRIVKSRYGKWYKKEITDAKIDKVKYKAMQQFRQAFTDDFVQQTSQEINDELDSHFHPYTAKFLKGLWADRMLYELAIANAWQITSTALAAISILDITGVTGVVSAYAKPICHKIVPFPCTSADLKCNGPVSALDDYTFYPYMDSSGNDIKKQSGGVEAAAKACSSDSRCKGFNSNGWMKHVVRDRSNWSRWTNDNSKGFYVKK